jgi:hypothetical protein
MPTTDRNSVARKPDRSGGGDALEGHSFINPPTAKTVIAFLDGVFRLGTDLAGTYLAPRVGLSAPP